MEINNSTTTKTHRYREAELSIIGTLKVLQDFASRLEWFEGIELINFILKDIEQHSFRIAVVGEFRRGKSTFINALLGKAILPSDILPTSATLNRVTYGTSPEVHIKFKATKELPARIEQVPIERLSDYVTKLTPEAKAIAATIEEAVVSYPVTFCKNNVDIIDTPGLSDEESLTAITKSILPKVHAVIMVIMATIPFSESEGEFLDYLLSQGLSKVLFVVSGIDLVDEDEKEKVLNYITKRIEKRLSEIADSKFNSDLEGREQFLKQVGKVKVFGVSGRQALKYRENKNEALWQSSGFAIVEPALYKFITEDSGVVALKWWSNQLALITKKMNEQLLLILGQSNSQKEKTESVYKISASLTEVLSQIIQVELEELDRASIEITKSIYPFGDVLFSEIVSEVERFINEYPITSDDFSSFNNESFHARIAEHLINSTVSITKKFASQIYEHIASNFKEVVTKVDPSAIAFDYVTKQMKCMLSEFQPELFSQNPFSELRREIFACNSTDLSNIDRLLTLPNDWLIRVFQKVRLPVGSFNWALRKWKESEFRSAFIQNANAEIRTHLDSVFSERVLLSLVKESLKELRQSFENTRYNLSSFLFSLRSFADRTLILQQEKEKELNHIKDKTLKLVDEVQIMVNLQGGNNL